ncbi:hypothetical protein BMETH_798_0 [methanotrophic bacterial endosymbiont of Bathymodiolus sp.]|nr:hypothetical protein BMETH_798_0 [methanotrophic bacterial endosymbiont of Bathymodiolus sp.]
MISSIVLASFPSTTCMTLRVSKSTATVTYLCPFRLDVSSKPS